DSEKYSFHYFQYIRNSQYRKNIKRYLNIFGTENVFIMKLENLDDDLPHLFEFLGIEDMSSLIETKDKINNNKTPRNIVANFFLKNRNVTQRAKLLIPDKLIDFSKSLLYKKSISSNLTREEERHIKDILKDELIYYYK